ncbi:MAG TPA: hypothetical protein VG649_01035, partial [Candidatus Angelobacter sp.]|nr:hypothetical protein [Candidatus Angelobacter sp.]
KVWHAEQRFLKMFVGSVKSAANAGTKANISRASANTGATACRIRRTPVSDAAFVVLAMQKRPIESTTKDFHLITTPPIQALLLRVQTCVGAGKEKG